MDDDPAASVRKKKDSSLVRAAELVRDGKACAMVSAGNTVRPWPRRSCAWVDCRRGSSVHRDTDSEPRSHAHGARRRWRELRVHARDARPVRPDGEHVRPGHYHVDRPRVGLLSIGEESTKARPW